MMHKDYAVQVRRVRRQSSEEDNSMNDGLYTAYATLITEINKSQEKHMEEATRGGSVESTDEAVKSAMEASDLRRRDCTVDN